MDKPPAPPDLYHLPTISKGAAESFAAQNHDFDQDWNELKQKQPDLAVFLMAQAEKLAPRNVRDKEIYTKLALYTYRLLQQQGEVNQLEETLGLKEPSNDGDASVRPLLDE